jgi:hypothetical protein
LGDEFSAKQLGGGPVVEGTCAQTVEDPALAKVRAARHDFPALEDRFMDPVQALDLPRRVVLHFEGAKLYAKFAASRRRLRLRL